MLEAAHLLFALDACAARRLLLSCTGGVGVAQSRPPGSQRARHATNAAFAIVGFGFRAPAPPFFNAALSKKPARACNLKTETCLTRGAQVKWASVEGGENGKGQCAALARAVLRQSWSCARELLGAQTVLIQTPKTKRRQ